MRIERCRDTGGTRTRVVNGDHHYTLPADPTLTHEVLRDVVSERPTATPPSGQPLAPVRPSTVFGMARNTGGSAREQPPSAFLKAPGSVTGPYSDIPVPAGLGRVDAEAELVVVMARPLRFGSGRRVLDHVLGYTVGLDITARQAQHEDPLWTTAKSRAGFTPLGPCIETEFDSTDAVITLFRDDQPVARGSTAELARGVVEILEYLSHLVELRPGDVVLTGAPNTFAPIEPGETLTAHIADIGRLTATVCAAPPVPEEYLTSKGAS